MARADGKLTQETRDKLMATSSPALVSYELTRKDARTLH